MRAVDTVRLLPSMSREEVDAFLDKGYRVRQVVVGYKNRQPIWGEQLVREVPIHD